MTTKIVDTLSVYLAIDSRQFAFSVYSIKPSVSSLNVGENQIKLIQYRFFENINCNHILYTTANILDAYFINHKTANVYLNCQDSCLVDKLFYSLKLFNNNSLNMTVNVKKAGFKDDNIFKNNLKLFKRYFDNNIVYLSENNLFQRLIDDFNFFDQDITFNCNNLAFFSVVEGAIQAKNSLKDDFFGYDGELFIYIAIGINTFAISTYIKYFSENSLNQNYDTLNLISCQSYSTLTKASVIKEIENILNNNISSNFKKSNIYIHSNNENYNQILYKFLQDKKLPINNISINYNNDDNFIDRDKLKSNVLQFKSYVEDNIINFDNEVTKKRIFNNIKEINDCNTKDLNFILSVVEGAIYPSSKKN